MQGPKTRVKELAVVGICWSDFHTHTLGTTASTARIYVTYTYLYVIYIYYVHIYIYVVIYDNVDQYITHRGRDIDSVYICNHLCVCLFV